MCRCKNFIIFLAIIAYAKPDKYLSSVLRICVKQDTQLLAIMCLGAYISPHWVIIRRNCIYDDNVLRASSTYMLGGNHNMDCTTGEKRQFSPDTDTLTVNGTEMALVSISRPFKDVPIVKLAKHARHSPCATFCSWKMLKLQGEARRSFTKIATIKELKSVCADKKIIKYDANVTSCHRHKHENGKVLCLKDPSSHVISKANNLFWLSAILNSPLICNGFLMGFFNEEDSDKVPTFTFLHAYVHELRKLIND